MHTDFLNRKPLVDTPHCMASVGRWHRAQGHGSHDDQGQAQDRHRGPASCIAVGVRASHGQDLGDWVSMCTSDAWNASHCTRASGREQALVLNGQETSGADAGQRRPPLISISVKHRALQASDSSPFSLRLLHFVCGRNQAKELGARQYVLLSALWTPTMSLLARCRVCIATVHTCCRQCTNSRQNEQHGHVFLQVH
jgi:hypothetical protein